MRKSEELLRSNSCFNRAADDELLFVLRGTDVAAPDTVRAWCRYRIEAGKNTNRDSQIVEALNWVEAVEEQQKRRTVTVGINVTYKSAKDAREKAEILLSSGARSFCLSVEDAKAVALELLKAAQRDEKAEVQRAAAEQNPKPPTAGMATADLGGRFTSQQQKPPTSAQVATNAEPFRYARQLFENARQQAVEGASVIAVMTGIQGRIALFDGCGRPLETDEAEAIAKAINAGRLQK